MPWLAGLALTQIIIGLYWLITRWIHLGPWNAGEKVSLRMLSVEMLVNGLPHFVFAYSFMRMIYPLMLLSLVYYIVWITFTLRAIMRRQGRCGVMLNQL
ncbi:MAG TPA: hypothetical protein VL485_22750 [Ktedonobacteraceae bacterium]|nr:hypothetical protein [Ktedonobacteraceae bacterium]